MTEVLVLVFVDAAGKDFALRIDDPRSDLTDTEVSAMMSLIIEKNIFDNTLVSPKKAYIITTTTEDIYEEAV